MAGTVALSRDVIKATIGTLWFLPGQAPDPSKMTDDEFKQSINYNTYYKNQSIEFLSNILTASVKNRRNLFLISSVAPPFETEQQHFEVHHKEWNALLYTTKAEGGLSNQPTYSEWMTTDNMGPIFEQNVPISVDIAHSDDFGYGVWMENLTELNENLVYTMMDGIIRNLIHTAFINMAGDWEMRTFSPDRLFAAEAHAFNIMALEPSAGFDLIRRMDDTMPGMNTIIGPKHSSRFFRGVGEESAPRHIEAKTLEYSEAEKRLVARVSEGPMSVKSYRIGDHQIDMLETEPFSINSKDPNPRNPLSTMVSLCQFFKPNQKRRTAGTAAVSIDPAALDIYIALQTQTMVEQHRVSFIERLRNCFYWNAATGEISDYVLTYIKQLNGVRGEAPWQWRDGGGSSDVNDDAGDYDQPDIDALRHTGDLHKMKSFRQKSAVVMYDPRERKYKPVRYIGDNHLDTLPCDDVMTAVEQLAMAFECKTGMKTATILGNTLALLENIRKAPVTALSLRLLIDTNMLNMMRNGTQLEPSMRNGFPEFAGNANGSLDLPEAEDGSLTGMKYFNGFHSGPGLLTARDWDLKPGAAFHQMAQEAKAALRDVELLIAFIREYVGERSGVIAPENTKPWFDTEDAVATFIDAIYPGQVPVFLGVPQSATYNKSAGSVGALQPNDFLITYLLREDSIPQGVRELRSAATPSTSIDAAVVALSCLSADVAFQYRYAILFASSAGRNLRAGPFDEIDRDDVYEAYTKACGRLFEFIISTTGYPTRMRSLANEDVENNRRVVSAVADKFFQWLAPVYPALIAPGSSEAASDAEKMKLIAQAASYVAKLTPKTFERQLPELQKRAAYESNEPNFAERLADVQATGLGLSPTLEERTVGSVEDGEDERRRERRGMPVTYFEGKYDGEPVRYMRSPLLSSPALIEFIAKSGFVWAMPADWSSNYTTPQLDITPLLRDARVRVERPLALTAQLSGFHAKLATHMRTGATPARRPAAPSRGRSASTATSKKRSADALFEFTPKTLSAGKRGRGGDEEDEMAAEKEMVGDVPAPAYAREMDDEVMRRDYVGPWRARMTHCAQIKGDFRRLMYKAVLETPNKLDVHERLAGIGAQLIDFLMFRPFVKFCSSSMIVMQRGEDVTATAMTKVDTDLSKEARGFFHLRVWFRFGHVNIDRAKIQALWYCIPESYEGGKKADFVTRRDQFNVSELARPSIACFPISIAERRFADTIHMLNKQFGRAPTKSDHPQAYRKWSGAGFYESVITVAAAATVEAMHNERKFYSKCVGMSHVAHLGPCAHVDAGTMKKEDSDGFGPGNSIRENIKGAEEVFLGTRPYFPYPHQTVTNWERNQ